MSHNTENVATECSHWTANESVQSSDPVLDWYTGHGHGD